MRIVFAGTSEFGIPALERLKAEHELLAVITRPDRPTGRKRQMTPPPVKEWADTNGIRVLQPEKIAESSGELAGLAPDAMVVAAYGQIIPDSVLTLPRLGCINIHGSLLPKYRGASPIQAALLNGDRETGVTLILMDSKMDHGPILAAASVTISDSDDYQALHGKLALAGADLLSRTLPGYESGTVVPTEQDHASATYVKLLTRADARIDWTAPAQKTLNQIRALNPEPGTWTTLHGKSVRIIKAEAREDSRMDLPGQVYADGRDCLVKCGSSSLRLVTVQPEGRKPMSGADFLNGLGGLETKILI